jgi:hypothetical protein
MGSSSRAGEEDERDAATTSNAVGSGYAMRALRWLWWKARYWAFPVCSASPFLIKTKTRNDIELPVRRGVRALQAGGWPPHQRRWAPRV